MSKPHLQLFTCVVSCVVAVGFVATARASTFPQESRPASAKETIKKITRAPKPLDSGKDELELIPIEAGIALPKPVIEESPAPGTRGHSPASEEVPAAAAAPAPKKVEIAAKPVAPASGKSIDAETSMRWLTNGNTRYVKKQTRADGRAPADRQRLLGGEHPHAVVLSCSDSRVPPELIFDQALGEIFTVRVAGEALDSSVIASIEYAVDKLGARLLVVMGHTKCSSIEGAMQPSDAGNGEFLERVLNDIRPRLKSVPTEKTSANLEVESTVNADGVARDLVKRSEIIRKKVEAGELVIKPALYRMDSGKVSFY